MFLLICFHGSHPQRYLSPVPPSRPDYRKFREGPELLSMAPCADQEQPAPPSRLEGRNANQEQPAPPSRLDGRKGEYEPISSLPRDAEAVLCFKSCHAPTRSSQNPLLISTVVSESMSPSPLYHGMRRPRTAFNRAMRTSPQQSADLGAHFLVGVGLDLLALSISSMTVFPCVLVVAHFLLLLRNIPAMPVAVGDGRDRGWTQYMPSLRSGRSADRGVFEGNQHSFKTPQAKQFRWTADVRSVKAVFPKKYIHSLERHGKRSEDWLDSVVKSIAGKTYQTAHQGLKKQITINQPGNSRQVLRRRWTVIKVAEVLEHVEDALASGWSELWRVEYNVSSGTDTYRTKT
ncbi:hypothetical protein B0H13DRAFT_1878590 [Mycena leptocephala]|nr:hypothetical protein B0H13DRAFT_1878590 [Mycena leptocephala]